MNLEDARNWATILGVAVGAVSLAVTAVNAWHNYNVNCARFWLELRDRFLRHDTTHRRLRPSGSWSTGNSTITPDDWPEIEAYLGLFEHCEDMIEQRLIDEATFTSAYRYRLVNVANSDSIVHEKLVRAATDWKRLHSLMKRMNVQVKGVE